MSLFLNVSRSIRITYLAIHFQQNCHIGFKVKAGRHFATVTDFDGQILRWTGKWPEWHTL